MKPFVVAATSAAVVAVAASTGYHGARRDASRAAEARSVTLTNARASGVFVSPRRSEISNDALNGVLHNTCGACHNDGLKISEMSLDSFTVENAAKRPQLAEKMIVKLRAGMMPPPGEDRPCGSTLQVLVATLEGILDKNAVAN